MSDKGRLILVTGGAGFIGANLCRALIHDGHEVLCLDNLQTARRSNLDALRLLPGFEFVEADVTDPLPVSVRSRADRIDRIYHLACAASPPRYQSDPEHTMLTNVVGTDNMLRLAESTGARFLLTSTSEIYGDPLSHPQPEDYRGNVNCTGPRACYDEGKRAAEALAFDFGRLGRADVRVARIFNTYGPFMDPCDGRVISNLVCQALRGEPLTIYGDGSQTRSFCFVGDTVRGLRLLMESELARLEPINLGNPEELTVTEIAERVLDVTGAEVPVINRPLPVDDPLRRRPDISRAASMLGWKPATPIDRGLPETVAWFSEELGVTSPLIPAKAAE